MAKRTEQSFVEVAWEEKRRARIGEILSEGVYDYLRAEGLLGEPLKESAEAED